MFERRLTPLEERVAFAVALELELRVLFERVVAGPRVDLYGVVDDELDRLQRVDPPWVAAEFSDGVSHRRQVYDTRDAGEVLQQHAGRPVGDLFGRRRARLPGGERLCVLARHRTAIFEAHEILEQNLQRVRQRRQVVAALGQRGEPEVGVFPAADTQRVAGRKAVRVGL